MPDKNSIPDAWDILPVIPGRTTTDTDHVAANLAQILIDHYLGCPESSTGAAIEIDAHAREIELPGLILWLKSDRPASTKQWMAVDKLVLDKVRALLRRKHWVLEMRLVSFWASRLYGLDGVMRMYPEPMQGHRRRGPFLHLGAIPEHVIKQLEE